MRWYSKWFILGAEKRLPVVQQKPWPPCGKSQICGLFESFMRTCAGHWMVGTHLISFGHGSHFLKKFLLTANAQRHRIERRKKIVKKLKIKFDDGTSMMRRLYLNLVLVKIYQRNVVSLLHSMLKNHVLLPARLLQVKYTKPKSLSFCSFFFPIWLLAKKQFFFGFVHKQSNEMN